MNFRPVWTATGPDGCLYFVDMYRGIIQESNWVGEGSYLRKVVQRIGLDQNIGRGRIYRVVHESKEPGPRPRMLEETPAELIAHLSHPNAWWRMTAQKLIILRGDRSVVPELKDLARNGKSALGRMHALWTLEGMDIVDRSLLLRKFEDPDYRVRVAAVRISEQLLKSGDEQVLSALVPLAKDENAEVALQTVLSLRYSKSDKAKALIDQGLAKRPKHARMRHAARSSRDYSPGQPAPELLSHGEQIYQSLCVYCHGKDGEGQVTGGQLMAPPLDGSPRVNGDKETLIRILLHGLAGPVNDRTYAAGVMMPMHQNTDEWIADVLTHIRQEWENDSSPVTPEEVAAVRQATEGRKAYWTLEELERIAEKAEAKN
jgi:mono/diheme cytochrome c family protein